MGIFFKHNETASRAYLAGRMPKPTKPTRNIVFFGPVAVFILMAVIIGIGVVAWQSSGGTAGPCLVEDKDRTTTQEGGSDMRVYTDCGVFQIGDNLWSGTFNSADTYSKIKVGSSYEFDTIGWRFGLLSQFPLILDVRIV